MADEVNPSVSVVLCVRNGGALLEDQLLALSHQQLEMPWELIVVDNECTDDSMSRVRKMAQRFQKLVIVTAHERAGLSYARNEGSKVARGAVIAYCDADDVVRPEWLANLVRAVHPGRIAGGALDYATLNDKPSRFWRNVGDSMEELPEWFDALPCVMGANFAITKTDLAAIGGFDEAFLASSDEVDLCYRAHQIGIEAVFVSDAVVDYRLRSTIREAARQQLGYGRSNVLIYRKHRAQIAAPSMRGTFNPYWALVRRVHELVRGRTLRGRWICDAAYRIGRLTESVESRVWFA
jgi:GT2 family glycosyltransferase